MMDIDFVRRLREGWLQRSIKISVLKGGISNEIYLVEDGDRFYKVRIPGKNTNFFSDRDGEITDLKALEKTDIIWKPDSNPTGVIPGVIDYQKDSKISIFSFVPGITAKKEDFKNPKIRARAIASVKRIHKCGVKFCRTLSLFTEIDRYANRLKGYEDYIMRDYPIDKFMKLTNTIQAELQEDRVKPVPCHNDLLSDNFILSDDRVHIIDWEFGGMNDPRFEIADLLIEHDDILTESDEDDVLQLYFGEQKNAMRGGVDRYKFIADYFWGLWAVIQYNVSELDFDFEKYARDRFDVSLRHVDMLKERYSIPF